MDLKPVNARNLAQCAARLQWTSGMTALFFILFDFHCCVVSEVSLVRKVGKLGLVCAASVVSLLHMITDLAPT